MIRSANLERPSRRASFAREDWVELFLSTAAGAALVWIPFQLAGLSAPVGFVLCLLAALSGIYGVVVYERHGLLAAKDRMATVAIGIFSSIALVVLFLMIFFVFRRGLAAMLSSSHFLTRSMSGVGPSDPVSHSGVGHALIGTLEQVGIAMVLTVPVGILAATYLNEVGGRFARVVRAIADAMTGLPTIIAGLFIYVIWVVPRKTNGQTGVAAGLALAIIMLPTVIRAAEEVLRIVSDSLREAALALGAPQWRVVMMVVIPTARAGLVTAAILGVARAVGETAPVLLTAGSNVQMNVNPLQHPQENLPVQIWTFLRSLSDNNVKEAWGAALLLVLIVLTLFALARILGTGGSEPRAKKAKRSRSRKIEEAEEALADYSPSGNLPVNHPFTSPP